MTTNDDLSCLDTSMIGRGVAGATSCDEKNYLGALATAVKLLKLAYEGVIKKKKNLPHAFRESVLPFSNLFSTLVVSCPKRAEL